MLFDDYLNLENTSNLDIKADQLIAESFLLDRLNNDEIKELTEDAAVCNELVNSEIVTEKTIVRLDKKAQIQRAFKTAVFTIARERNDRDFRKLLTCWKMERALESKLMKKYHAEATKRAKASVAKLASAKKDTKHKVIKKATGK